MVNFSGYFLCPKCNLHGDWTILERIVKKAKVEVSIKDYIDKLQNDTASFKNEWENVIKDTMSMSALNETELLDLFRLYEFPVRFI